jgi:hypothetical protein
MIQRFSRSIPVFIIALAIATLGYAGSGIAHAAGPSQAITLTPASTDVAIDAGSSVSKTVDVINSGTNAFTVKLTSDPYYVSGDNYDPHFTQLPGTVDASSWVHLSLTSSSVAGQKVLTVPTQLTYPKARQPVVIMQLFSQRPVRTMRKQVLFHTTVSVIFNTLPSMGPLRAVVT